MTELAAPQISSLMEALPGIAAVLRSPVANAMVAVSRAAAGLEEFQLSHAEELLKFGVRRNLLTPEEVEKVSDELRDVAAGRPPKPVPPPVKKPAAEAEMPKVPHRPKGIQLKPVPKRPIPELAPMAVTPPPVAAEPADKAAAPVAKPAAPVAKAPAKVATAVAAKAPPTKAAPVAAKAAVVPAKKPGAPVSKAAPVAKAPAKPPAKVAAPVKTSAPIKPAPKPSAKPAAKKAPAKKH